MKYFYPIFLMIFQIFANNVESSSTDSVISVSMYQLLANPENYDDVKVNVTGIVRIEFENLAIFVDQSSYNYNIEQNGFWLSSFADDIQFSQRGLPPREWNKLSMRDVPGKWISMTAIFDVETFSNGYVASFLNIEDICILNEWPTDTVQITR